MPYGGFQGSPEVKAHDSCGQRGTAHLLLSVAATVHGLVYTRYASDLQLYSTNVCIVGTHASSSRGSTQNSYAESVRRARRM